MGDIPNKEEARGIAATYEGMVLSDGKMHCPALLTLQQAHDPVADYRQGKIDEAEFRRLMALRERLEMRVHSVEEDGSVRVACPALDGRVSCPLRRSDLKAKKAGMKKVSGGKAPLPLSPKQTPKKGRRWTLLYSADSYHSPRHRGQEPQPGQQVSPAGANAVHPAVVRHLQGRSRQQ